MKIRDIFYFRASFVTPRGVLHLVLRIAYVKSAAPPYRMTNDVKKCKAYIEHKAEISYVARSNFLKG